jgi:hypothetical protein
LRHPLYYTPRQYQSLLLVILLLLLLLLHLFPQQQQLLLLGLRRHWGLEQPVHLLLGLPQHQLLLHHRPGLRLHAVLHLPPAVRHCSLLAAAPVSVPVSCQ